MGSLFRLRFAVTVLLVLLVWGVGSKALAQSQRVVAAATIALSARLPSSVSLAQDIFPVSIVVKDGIQTAAELALDVKWNLDLREAEGYRLMATLQGAGLKATPGPEVSAEHMEACVDGSECRSFAPGHRGMVLANDRVTAANRNGTGRFMVQLRIEDDRLEQLPDGIYTGLIKLEAELI